MSSDSRGWKIALVPDALINPSDELRATLPDILSVLETNGYGVLQLPPPGQHGLLFAVLADQVAEYAHHGYAVLAIGVRGEPGNGLPWRHLAPLLRHRGVSLPVRYLVRPSSDVMLEGQHLAAFLQMFDLPSAACAQLLSPSLADRWTMKQPPSSRQILTPSLRSASKRLQDCACHPRNDALL